MQVIAASQSSVGEEVSYMAVVVTWGIAGGVEVMSGTLLSQLGRSMSWAFALLKLCILIYKDRMHVLLYCSMQMIFEQFFGQATLDMQYKPIISLCILVWLGIQVSRSDRCQHRGWHQGILGHGHKKQIKQAVT